MSQKIIEFLPTTLYNDKEVANKIQNKRFKTKTSFIKALVKAGLPERTHWSVKVYTLDEVIEKLNLGKEFNTLAVIQLTESIPSNRLAEFSNC